MYVHGLCTTAMHDDFKVVNCKSIAKPWNHRVSAQGIMQNFRWDGRQGGLGGGGTEWREQRLTFFRLT